MRSHPLIYHCFCSPLPSQGHSFRKNDNHCHLYPPRPRINLPDGWSGTLAYLCIGCKRRERGARLSWREGSQFVFTLEQLTRFSFLPVGLELKQAGSGPAPGLLQLPPHHQGPREQSHPEPHTGAPATSRFTSFAGGLTLLTLLKPQTVLLLPRKPQETLDTSTIQVFSHLQGVSHRPQV